MGNINKYEIGVGDEKTGNITTLTLNIDSSNRYWIDGLPFMDELKARKMEDAVFNMIKDGDVKLSDEDKAYVDKLTDKERLIKEMLIYALSKNVEEYYATLADLEENKELKSALSSFQSRIADILDNPNIEKYGWGEIEFMATVKHFIRFDNSVMVENIDLNMNALPITVCDGNGFVFGEYLRDREIEYTENRFDAKMLAGKILKNAVYFLVEDEVVSSGYSLYKIADDVIKYADIEKKIEIAKDDIAKEWVEHKDEPDFWEMHNTFSDFFKDYFGHRPRVESDFEMLEQRYKDAVREGRIEAKEPEESKEKVIIKDLDEISPFTEKLLGKAKEIKALLDSNEKDIRHNNKPVSIEVYSNTNDQGKTYGNIKIVNGGEAIKLSYDGKGRCTDCKYNDHIFHGGEYQSARDRFDEGMMKTVLNDVFILINDGDKFSPNIENKGRTKATIKE